MTIGLAAITWTKVLLAPLAAAFALTRPPAPPTPKPFPFFGE
jgi:hypothetical protein